MNIVEIIIRGVDQATKPLNAPIKSLKDLQSVASKLGPIVAATTAALGTAFVGLTRHAINLQDETGKLAQKAGTTSEEFSTLAHAAKLSDVSNEQLAKGLRELGSQIDDVARGTATANNVLVRLGISAKDAEGRARPVAEVLREVSEAFKNLDTQSRSQFAKDVGRNFAEMVPLLSQGREAIEKLQAEARSFGLEVSGETAQAAEEFNDNLTRMQALARGVSMTIAKEVVPILSRLSAQMVESAKNTADMGEKGQFFATVLKILATVGLTTWAALKTLVDLLAGALRLAFDNVGTMTELVTRTFYNLKDGVVNLARAFVSVLTAAGGVGDVFERLFSGDFDGAWQSAKATVTDVGKALGDVGNSIGETFSNQFKIAKDAGDDLFNNLKSNGSAALQTLDENVKALGKTVVNIWADVPTTPPPPDKNDPPPPVFDDKALLAFEEKRAAALMKARELERAINEETLTGMERIRQQAENDYLARNAQIAQLLLDEDEAISLSLKNHEAYQAKLRQIEADGAKARQQVMQQHLHNTSEIFGNMAAAAKAFGRKGFAAWKAFATAQAIIDTYGAANKAYHAMAGIPFVGPALGVAAAAAAIAAGLANVAAIQSTQPAGAAHGGLDYVPAEATYLLDKGERVLSPKQNEDFTEALENGGVGGAQVINVKVELEGRVLGEAIYDLTRTGRAQIHPRAVTDR